MKKIILSLILACSVAVMTAGCSCSSSSPLSFNKAWSPKNAAFGYTETCVYDVNFNKNFIDGDFDFSQSESVKDLLDVNFTDGTYIVTVKICGKSDLPKNADSDIFEGLSDYELYRITSELKITSVYTPKNGEQQTYEEFVKTDCYTLDAENSLAPVYSFTENKFSGVSIGNDEVNISTTHYTTEILYGKEEYYIYKNTYNFDDDVSLSMPKETETLEYDYTFKSIVDNNSLLFCIRNLSVTTDSSKTVPVVSASYGSSKELSIATDANVTVKIGETEYTAKRISFVRNASVDTGRKQLVYIDANESSNARMLKYVTPLGEYGSSYMGLGALEYTLRG